MRLLLLTLAISASALARPELYKENEDFQYARSSTDEGSKSGYYGAQRGNMGGNYEKSHNMDGLAQHQMSGLVKQVDGELGDGAQTRVGDVYTAANSRGMYGSGHYDLSNLQGRRFNEGVHYDNSQTHSSLASHGSSYTGHSLGYTGQSVGYTGQSAGYTGHSSGYTGQSSGYTGQSIGFTGQSLNSGHQGSYGLQSDNLQSIDSTQGANTNTYVGTSGQSQYSSGRYAQSAYQAHDVSSTGQRLVAPSVVPQNKLIWTVPVTVVGRPGSRVAIPVGVQNYDAAHSATFVDQNAINSDTEVLSNAGHVYEPQLATGGKHYESSYTYRKQWEKHDTKPEVVVLSVPTENPFPKNSELHEDALTSNTNHYQAANAQAIQSSSFNSASHIKAEESQAQSGYNSHYSGLSSGSNLNALTNVAATNGAQTFGVDATRPKSYQSSYSYHKSWERQGDPYEIPVGQSSQRLVNNNGYSSNQYATKNHQSRASYSGNGLCCVEDGKVRVARAAGGQKPKPFWPNQDTEDFGQDTQQAQAGWNPVPEKLEDLGEQSDLGQQTQSAWNDGFENFGQQTQDLGQQAQTGWDQGPGNFGQQTQNFGRQNEDLGQQSQTGWDQGLENFGQQSQNVDLGQQTEDLGQQSQTGWDQGLDNFDQQSQNVDNFGQQTEDLGQQSQNGWTRGDLGQQLRQGRGNSSVTTTTERWHNLLDINEFKDKKRHRHVRSANIVREEVYLGVARKIQSAPPVMFPIVDTYVFANPNIQHYTERYPTNEQEHNQETTAYETFPSPAQEKIYYQQHQDLKKGPTYQTITSPLVKRFHTTFEHNKEKPTYQSIKSPKDKHTFYPISEHSQETPTYETITSPLLKHKFYPIIEHNKESPTYHTITYPLIGDQYYPTIEKNKDTLYHTITSPPVELKSISAQQVESHQKQKAQNVIPLSTLRKNQNEQVSDESGSEEKSASTEQDHDESEQEHNESDQESNESEQDNNKSEVDHTQTEQDQNESKIRPQLLTFVKFLGKPNHEFHNENTKFQEKKQQQVSFTGKHEHLLNHEPSKVNTRIPANTEKSIKNQDAFPRRQGHSINHEFNKANHKESVNAQVNDLPPQEEVLDQDTSDNERHEIPIIYRSNIEPSINNSTHTENPVTKSDNIDSGEIEPGENSRESEKSTTTKNDYIEGKRINFLEKSATLQKNIDDLLEQRDDYSEEIWEQNLVDLNKNVHNKGPAVLLPQENKKVVKEDFFQKQQRKNELMSYLTDQKEILLEQAWSQNLHKFKADIKRLKEQKQAIDDYIFANTGTLNNNKNEALLKYVQEEIQMTTIRQFRHDGNTYRKGNTNNPNDVVSVNISEVPIDYSDIDPIRPNRPNPFIASRQKMIKESGFIQAFWNTFVNAASVHLKKWF